jgi:S1-C subfamily serine protease
MQQETVILIAFLTLFDVTPADQLPQDQAIDDQRREEQVRRNQATKDQLRATETIEKLREEEIRLDQAIKDQMQAIEKLREEQISRNQATKDQIRAMEEKFRLEDALRAETIWKLREEIATKDEIRAIEKRREEDIRRNPQGTEDEVRAIEEKLRREDALRAEAIEKIREEKSRRDESTKDHIQAIEKLRRGAIGLNQDTENQIRAIGKNLSRQQGFADAQSHLLQAYYNGAISGTTFARAVEISEQSEAALEAIEREREKLKRDDTIPNDERSKRNNDMARANQNISEVQLALTKELPKSRTLEPLIKRSETIRSLLYPLYAVCAGNPWLYEQRRQWDAELNRVKAQLEEIVPKVGRFMQYGFEADGKRQLREIGATAFALGGPYILTNAHVVKQYAEKVGGRWQLFRGQELSVLFPKEYSKCANQTASVEAKVLEVELVGEGADNDYAVLKTDQRFSAIPLADSDNLAEGVEVVTIGYPSKPVSCGEREPTEDNPCTYLTDIEIKMLLRTPDDGHPTQVERISPGDFLDNTAIDKDQFSYTASTWGGSSGSPVVSLVDGKVVGLHFQGMNARTENVGYNNAIRINKIRSVLEEKGYIKR